MTSLYNTSLYISKTLGTTTKKTPLTPYSRRTRVTYVAAACSSSLLAVKGDLGRIAGTIARYLKPRLSLW